MVIGTTVFKGMSPRLAPHLLPEDMAYNALDLDLSSGSLTPLAAPKSLAGTTVLSTAKTVFRSKYSGLWDSSADVVDIARSPLADDAYDRAYFTSDAAGAVPGMCQNWMFDSPKILGLPSPPKCSASVVGTAGDDPLLAETRTYVTCYLTSFGELGPPSQPCNALTVYPDEGNSVSVTIPAAPVGAYAVTHVNIYRSNTGSESSAYQFVASVAIGAGPYSDTWESGLLGEVLPSEEWVAPPSGMLGMCNHPAGFLCGFKDRNLCLSERYLPHAWPIAYRYAVDDEIVAIAVFGASVLVLTTGLPFVVTGEDPSAMTVQKLEGGGACVARRGVVDMGEYVVYPSLDGLMAVGVGLPPKNLTEGLATREFWEGLDMSSMIAARYRDEYLAVFPSFGLLFDPRTSAFVPLSLTTATVKAMFYDSEYGDLYLRQGTNTYLESFNDHATSKLSWFWESKTYRLPYPLNFSCGKVLADSYPVTVKIYIDGALKYTATVSGRGMFRLPAGYRSETFQYRLEGTTRVFGALFANSPAELVAYGS
jgi:hypothetical protein